MIYIKLKNITTKPLNNCTPPPPQAAGVYKYSIHQMLQN